MKDQKMKKIRSALALAGLLACVAIRSDALVIDENFTNDPALDGWQAFGDTNLFQWDSTNRVLDVTWDSSQSNSYFFHPLGMTLSDTNDFMLGFTIQLQDIASGVQPGYPSTFQVAIGLFNHDEATNENFIIGTGYNAPDIVEFDYFPAFSSYPDSFSTPIISSENAYPETFITKPFTMFTGVAYHAVMTYVAADQTMYTTITSNGVPVGPAKPPPSWGLVLTISPWTLFRSTATARRARTPTNMEALFMPVQFSRMGPSAICSLPTRCPS